MNAGLNKKCPLLICVLLFTVTMEDIGRTVPRMFCVCNDLLKLSQGPIKSAISSITKMQRCLSLRGCENTSLE